MSLKFNNQEVRAAMELDNVPLGFSLELVVSGVFNDGTQWIGSDSILIVR